MGYCGRTRHRTTKFEHSLESRILAFYCRANHSSRLNERGDFLVQVDASGNCHLLAKWQNN